MLLVTGGNGNLGRLIVAELAARIGPSFAVSVREPAKAADLAAAGISVRQGNYDDEEAMARAFDGAETVLLISGDTPNEIRIPQHRNAIHAALRAGVKRVAYTSFVANAPDSAFPYAAVHRETEAMLQASGLAYTILRDSYMAETMFGVSRRALSWGRFAIPGGQGRVAWVRRIDAARAAVGALLGEGHENKVYALTGPAAYRYQDVAAALSELVGRNIPYVDISPEEYETLLSRENLPNVVNLLGSAAAIKRDEFNVVTKDIETLSGTAPEDAMQFYRREGKKLFAGL